MMTNTGLLDSVLAVAKLTQCTADSLSQILSAKHAPEQLFRINDEISEIKVLMAIAESTTRRSENYDVNLGNRLGRLLSHAEKLLHPLGDIITQTLTTNSENIEDGAPKREVRWSSWVAEETKVRQLTANLSELRQSIYSVLQGVSKTELPSIRVSVEGISVVRRDTLSDIHIPERPMPQPLPQPRLEDVDRGMQNLILASSIYADPGPSRRLLYDVTDEDAMFQKELEIQSVVHLPRSQLEVCHCKCHANLAIRSPKWLGAAIGTILFHYASGAIQNCPKCTGKSCRGNSSSTVRSVYYFPGWIMRRMVSMQISWNQVKGHSLTLRTPRIISTNSSVFLFAQHGNIQGMQRLFAQHLASPFDVSLEEGRSPLHFAVTAVKPQMISFLLTQGADPELEDRNQLTAHDVVWNYYMQNPGDTSIEILMESAGLTPSDTDSLEKRQFSLVHRIVLGLSKLNLRAYLAEDTSDIDKPDIYGKTPLCWAASRPNPKTVEILLEYGASLTKADLRDQTPVHYCAGSGHYKTMELLLKAAVANAKQAQSKERLRLGISPLVQRGFTTEPILTDIKHVVDARDSKGRTPLNFSTPMNFPIHTQLLISYGADVECPDTVLGRTIFLFNIYWNSHKTLPILLDNGAQTNVLDARNASLLHYAARFANAETLQILAKAKLGRLDILSYDDTANTPWEIFNNALERCVAEQPEERRIADHAFRDITKAASGDSVAGSHRFTEVEEWGTSEVFVGAYQDPARWREEDDVIHSDSSAHEEWFDAIPKRD